VRPREEYLIRNTVLKSWCLFLACTMGIMWARRRPEAVIIL